MKTVKLSVSLLTADFSNALPVLQSIVDGGADMLHFDVMDGVFVPNFTFGMKFVADYRGRFDIPFDVHLMMVNPEKYVAQFAKAGADILSFHIESTQDVLGTIASIQQCNVKVGLVLNPDTTVESIMPYIDSVDMVTVMLVNAGFGGQTIIMETLDKVTQLRQLRPDMDISVDGGVTLDNVNHIVQCGANIIVSGSTVLNSNDISKTIAMLQGK